MVFIVKSSATRSSSPSTLTYGSSDAVHELNYIPFAKASRAFVRQTDDASSPHSPVISQWSATNIGDAKVPKLDDALEYDEIAPPCVQDLEKRPTCFDNSSNPTIYFPSIALKANGSQQDMVDSAVAGSDIQQPSESATEYFQHYTDTSFSNQNFDKDQYQYQRNSESAIVIELPPPRLGTRRPRKLHGSWSLNRKYEKMKHDMDLMVQNESLQRRQQMNVPTYIYNSPTPAFEQSVQRAIKADFNPYRNLATPGFPVHTDLGSRQPSFYQGYQSMLKQGKINQGPYSTSLNDLQNKRARLDSRLCHPGYSVDISNVAPIDNGVFSLPHFRFSSSASNHALRASTKVSAQYLPYSSPGTMASLEDGFDDNPVFEHVPLSDETLLTESINPLLDVGGSFQFRSQPGASNPQVMQRRKRGSDDVREEEEQGQHTIDFTGNSCTDSSLDHRPQKSVGLVDRIHQVGSEIRASVSAAIPRFGGSILRNMDKEEERRQLRLRSRFGLGIPCIQRRPRDLTKSFPKLVNKHLTSGGNKTSDLQRSNSDHNPSAAPTLNMDSDSANLSNSIMPPACEGCMLPATPSSVTKDVVFPSDKRPHSGDEIKSTDQDMHRISLLEQEIKSVVEY
ncbi:hypothetical protein BX616_008317 [Lobosporangium transversale]|uniref:Uncharacterized protein n=1 Tax=Lobosporangium transversale TaxID=64571 RepID=A0A1Y2GKQ1_9FUNG|nr:hypothetical protein BCR41DRAFT_397005 [Lobosporangium transversale]KAF9914429.1 hypothetical protein BX616_008317 [Lobosporangium transversale]ORZ13843.1 hypothetical protein BCR41DRAFT_397005 [Lobosporangium transversale]|eukprot:XP_021880627.1 hypothetical protein BCR41DRAFT_397005 [Lobosporangium transversale]